MYSCMNLKISLLFAVDILMVRGMFALSQMTNVTVEAADGACTAVQ